VSFPVGPSSDMPLKPLGLSMPLPSSSGRLFDEDLHHRSHFHVLLEIIKYEGLSVSQYGQRLITPDDVEGAFDARPPTYVPSKPTKLSVCDDTKGTFGARPLAYIPNKCRIHVIMTD
jgi:hypothetical protein